MAPITHFLASWLVAAKTTDNQRDCSLVTLAGVLPDADGLGLVVDFAKQWVGTGGPPFYYYQRYHHFWLHGIFGGLLIAGLLACFARRRWRVAGLALLVFHLHLLCDLAGSRGPAPEDLWPIFYLGPFTKDVMWMWSGQWRLDGWFNRLLTVGLFLAALWLATLIGRSVVGVFSRRADAVFVGVLRKWRADWVGRSG